MEALPVPQSTVEFVHSTLWCFNAFFGVLAVFGAIAVGMRRQKLGILWPWLFLWPAYQALVTIAAWRAMLELWRDPFGWVRPSTAWREAAAAALASRPPAARSPSARLHAPARRA